ncbi:MAG TPA: hypothetical protein VG755_00665 [Nannocystaceae bacterium]|nr:hypothetical protein [Nannocystaceae bacterium]
MTNSTRLLSLTWLALSVAACADVSSSNATDMGMGESGDDGIDLSAGADADDGDGADEGASADGGADDGMDDGGAGEEGGAVDCGGDLVMADLAMPKVMLVLDKSGSMASEEWDDDGDAATPEVTRWHSLHGIVADLVNARGNVLELGAALFPAQGADHRGDFDEACMVADAAEVAIAADNGAAILAAMPAADAEVRGGTPTREGLLNAIEALTGMSDDAPRAMILVTDGAANCVQGADPFNSQYDDELALAVGSAFVDNGIPTYVIGVDIRDERDDMTGRNVHDELGAVAIAGGTARAGEVPFYDAASAVALRDALDVVADRVSCTVQLPDAATDPSRATLDIAGIEQARVDSCEDGDGWRWVSTAAPFSTIELCGATCDAFASAGKLETHYACLPVG